jgi:hypothetical protein
MFEFLPVRRLPAVWRRGHLRVELSRLLIPEADARPNVRDRGAPPAGVGHKHTVSLAAQCARKRSS